MRGPKGERIRLPAGGYQLKAAWEGGHGVIAASRKQRSVSSCARGTEHGFWGGSDLGSSQTPVTCLLGDLEWGHWICLSLDSRIWKSGVVACTWSAGDVTLQGIRAPSGECPELAARQPGLPPTCWKHPRNVSCLPAFVFLWSGPQVRCCCVRCDEIVMAKHGGCLFCFSRF